MAAVLMKKIWKTHSGYGREQLIKDCIELDYVMLFKAIGACDECLPGNKRRIDVQ